MTQVAPFGAAFRKPPPDYGPLAELVAGMREAITADIRVSVLEELPGLLAGAVAQIRVAPAQVTVAAPVVNIDNELPGEDDAGEIEAMDRQTKILTQISQQLAQLITLAKAPVTTTVERTDGVISRTIASR